MGTKVNLRGLIAGVAHIDPCKRNMKDGISALKQIKEYPEGFKRTKITSAITQAEKIKSSLGKIRSKIEQKVKGFEQAEKNIKAQIAILSGAFAISATTYQKYQEYHKLSKEEEETIRKNNKEKAKEILKGKFIAKSKIMEIENYIDKQSVERGNIFIKKLEEKYGKLSSIGDIISGKSITELMNESNKEVDVDKKAKGAVSAGIDATIIGAFETGDQKATVKDKTKKGKVKSSGGKGEEEAKVSDHEAIKGN